MQSVDANGLPLSVGDRVFLVEDGRAGVIEKIGRFVTVRADHPHPISALLSIDVTTVICGSRDVVLDDRAEVIS